MAVSERKFFVGGNWKMNGSKGMIDVILDTLNGGNLNTDTGNYFALIYWDTCVDLNMYSMKLFSLWIFQVFHLPLRIWYNWLLIIMAEDEVLSAEGVV